MGMLELLVIVLILLLVFGSLPLYPYSRSWGYYPSGGLVALLAIVLLLLLLF